MPIFKSDMERVLDIEDDPVGWRPISVLRFLTMSLVYHHLNIPEMVFQSYKGITEAHTGSRKRKSHSIMLFKGPCLHKQWCSGCEGPVLSEAAFHQLNHSCLPRRRRARAWRARARVRAHRCRNAALQDRSPPLRWAENLPPPP